MRPSSAPAVRARRVVHAVDKIKANTFVMRAMVGDEPAVLKALSLGVDVNSVHSELHRTALHAAVDSGNETMVRLLVDYRADVNNAETDTRETALHYAAAGTTPAAASLVAFLLRRGANKRLANADGLMPLNVAVYNRKDPIITLLAEPPDAPSSVECKCWSPTRARVAWLPPPVHNGLVIVAFSLELLVVNKEGKEERTLGHRLPPDARFFEATELQADTQYTVAVRARNLGGWSRRATTIMRTPGYPPAKPTIPVVLHNLGDALVVQFSTPPRVGSAPVLEHEVEVVYSDASDGHSSDDEHTLAANRDRAKVASRPRSGNGTSPSAQGRDGDGGGGASGAASKDVTFEAWSREHSRVVAADMRQLKWAPDGESSDSDSGKGGISTAGLWSRGGTAAQSPVAFAPSPLPSSRGAMPQLSPVTVPADVSTRRATAPNLAALSKVQHPSPLGLRPATSSASTLRGSGGAAAAAAAAASGVGGYGSARRASSSSTTSLPQPSRRGGSGGAGAAGGTAGGTAGAGQAGGGRGTATAPASQMRLLRVSSPAEGDPTLVRAGSGDRGAVESPSSPPVAVAVGGLKSGVVTKIRVHTRNEFGWSEYSSETAYVLDPAPVATDVGATQVTLRCCTSDWTRLHVQMQVCQQDVADGCVVPLSPTAAHRKWYGPWLDAPVSPESLRGLLLTVRELLPGTRYRFRQRGREDVLWEQCPESEVVRTRNLPPDRPKVILAVSLTPGDVLVAWHPTRSNGARQTKYRIVWRRVYQRVTSDDSGSEVDDAVGALGLDARAGAEEDAATRSSAAALAAAVAAAPKRQRPRSGGGGGGGRGGAAADAAGGAARPRSAGALGARKTLTVDVHAASDGDDDGGDVDGGDDPDGDGDGVAEVDVDGDGNVNPKKWVKHPGKAVQVIEMTVATVRDYMRKYTMEPMRTYRSQQLTSEPSFQRLPANARAMFEEVPGPEVFGTRGKIMRFSVNKALQAGGYYNFGVRGMNAAGWSDVAWFPTPVRMKPSVPQVPSTPVSVAMSPSKLQVAWSIRRTNGSRILSYRVWHKRCTDMEEERYHDPSVAKHLRKALEDSGSGNGTWQMLPETANVVVSTYPPNTALVRMAADGTEIHNEIYRGLEPGRRWAMMELDGLGPPGSYHRFRVQSVNEVGVSVLSGHSRVVRLLPAVCDAPVCVDCRTLSTKSGVLSWLAPNPNGATILNYLVQQQRWLRRPPVSRPTSVALRASEVWDGGSDGDGGGDAGIGPVEECTFEPPPPDENWRFVDALVTHDVGTAAFLALPAAVQEDVAKTLLRDMRLRRAYPLSEVELLQNRDNDDDDDGADSAAAIGGDTAAIRAAYAAAARAQAERDRAVLDADDSEHDVDAMLTRRPRPLLPQILSLVVNDLEPGAGYSFRVLAYNSEGCSGPGPAVALPGLKAVPSQPEPPRLYQHTPHSVVVVFTAPDTNGAAVTQYRLERFDVDVAGVCVPDPQWQVVTMSDAVTQARGMRYGNEYVDVHGTAVDVSWVRGRPFAAVVVPDLPPASLCRYRVAARNEVGWSEPSAANQTPVRVLPDRPSQPWFTFVHVLPPDRVVVEFTVETSHGEPVSGFDVDYRELVVDADAEVGEDADTHSYTPWRMMERRAKVSVTKARDMPALVAAAPRNWDADRPRWAYLATGINPLDRVSFRVRVANVVGVSDWSEPSIDVRASATPPNSVATFRVIRHHIVPTWRVLCFTQRASIGGARVDAYHIEFKQDETLLSPKQPLLVREWTTAGFPTTEEVQLRDVNFTCCRGVTDHLHFVVKHNSDPRLAADMERCWLQYRIRSHSYAGWGPYFEQRSAVAFPA